MKQYTDILREILARGRRKVNRTGIDTIAIKGPSMRFHMDDGFPMLTERPIYFKGVKHENIWFLGGVCNNEDLLAVGVGIWDQWALKEAVTYTMQCQGHELVEQLVTIRNAGRAEDQAAYTFQDAVAELTAADMRDAEAGKPITGKPLDAKSNDELQGGFAILREAGVNFDKTVELMPKGYLGPIYGVMWRNWITHDGRQIDQIDTIVTKLSSENPKERYSRSLLVTALNPAVTPEESMSAEENIKKGKQALAPCHTFFQLLAEPLTVLERINLHTKKDPGYSTVRDMLATSGAGCDLNDYNSAWFNDLPAEDQEKIVAELDTLNVPKDQLSLIMYQRSADFPIGVPFNIAGYALLLHMFAHVLNMKPAEFVHHFGDAHIYVNQIDGVNELLARADNPDSEVPALPQLWLNPEVKSIFDFKPEDIKLVNYEPLRPQISFGDIAI